MLTIQLEGQLEDRLKRAAESAGAEPVVVARQVLEEHLPRPNAATLALLEKWEMHREGPDASRPFKVKFIALIASGSERRRKALKSADTLEVQAVAQTTCRRHECDELAFQPPRSGLAFLPEPAEFCQTLTPALSREYRAREKERAPQSAHLHAFHP